MSLPKRIIFTGQPGIKSEGILQEFIQSYPLFPSDNAPHYIKVEDRMRKIYCRERSLDAEDIRVWLRFLSEPISTIVKTSEDALKEIVDEVEGSKLDIFLNCHACFYHLQTLEHIALPNIRLLKLFKPSKIITFIDDIYDIHVRLRQQRQLLVGNVDEVDPMIFALLRILDWRINEISMSRYLSNQLEIADQHYVFSVKHPAKTLYDLIYDDTKKVLYLSHPNSQPRRNLEAGKRHLADPIIKEIKEVSEYFSNKFVCFLPTTIDELRILDQKDAKGNREKFVYGLKERWDNELYSKNNAHTLFGLPLNEAKRIPFGEPAPETPSTPYLLEVLFRTIDRQVSIRDKKLVEQSQVLFIYRPGFEANLSKGVRYELDYYILLNQAQQNKINCFIYYPVSDQNQLKIKIFYSLLGEIGYKIDIFDEATFIKSYLNESELATYIETVFTENNLEPKINTGTLTQDEFAERERFFTKFAQENIKKFGNEIEYYKLKSDVFIEKDNLRPFEIVHEIEQELKKIR